jgi:hypothetical protein
MKLPEDQREMLLEIVRARQTAARRQDIAAAARESVDAFRAGALLPQTADEVIRLLAASSDDDGA